MFESEGLVISFSDVADRLSVLTSTFLPFRLIFIGCFCVLASELLSFLSLSLQKETAPSFDQRFDILGLFVISIVSISHGLPPLRLRGAFPFRRCGR